MLYNGSVCDSWVHPKMASIIHNRGFIEPGDYNWTFDEIVDNFFTL